MSLHALSPLDGRYQQETSALRDHFSEFAFMRARARVELDYLSALASTGLVRPLTDSERGSLDDFGDEDAQQIQAYERETKHDLKAIEYYLRHKLPADLHPWIHFGLTSEDVNNIALALALRDARDYVLLPELDRLLSSLRDFARKYRALPMLARTHGQPAVPTTLGKEIAVALARARKIRDEVAAHGFEAKLTGAVGGYNALQAAAPQVDWLAVSERFVRERGLQPNQVTTQILPYDNWIRFFDLLRLLNSALLDYAQDMWTYVGVGYLRQAVVENEVGSSTMPQKVNPILFENAEGNLGIANALFTHFGQKLPVSRFQRDLSDSTVRRTFGTAIGHTLLAWTNLRHGMGRIEADEEVLRADLNSHWEVISEGAQTILRAAGRSDAYESLKSHLRGRGSDEAGYRHWVETLELEEITRERLLDLSPEKYIGLAVEITDEVIGGDD